MVDGNYKLFFWRTQRSQARLRVLALEAPPSQVRRCRFKTSARWKAPLHELHWYGRCDVWEPMWRNRCSRRLYRLRHNEHSYFGDSDVSGLPAKGYSVDIFEWKSFLVQVRGSVRGNGRGESGGATNVRVLARLRWSVIGRRSMIPHISFTYADYSVLCCLMLRDTLWVLCGFIWSPERSKKRGIIKDTLQGYIYN